MHVLRIEWVGIVLLSLLNHFDLSVFFLNIMELISKEIERRFLVKKTTVDLDEYRSKNIV